MQSFGEKDLSGSKVGSNPASGHPGLGIIDAKLTSLDKDVKPDSMSVEDKIEAVAAALSKEETSESTKAGSPLQGQTSENPTPVEGLAKLDGGKKADDSQSLEDKIEAVAKAIQAQVHNNPVHRLNATPAESLIHLSQSSICEYGVAGSSECYSTRYMFRIVLNKFEGSSAFRQRPTFEIVCQNFDLPTTYCKQWQVAPPLMLNVGSENNINLFAQSDLSHSFK